MRVRSRITLRHVNATSSRPSLGRRHFQPALHRRTREAAVEPRLHMKKAAEADDLARFVKADQVAHSAEQRNIGDAVISAHHPVAAGEPFVEDTEQPR
jgi:hypothetical protein